MNFVFKKIIWPALHIASTLQFDFVFDLHTDFSISYKITSLKFSSVGIFSWFFFLRFFPTRFHTSATDLVVSRLSLLTLWCYQLISSQIYNSTSIFYWRLSSFFSATVSRLSPFALQSISHSFDQGRISRLSVQGHLSPTDFLSTSLCFLSQFCIQLLLFPTSSSLLSWFFSRSQATYLLLGSSAQGIFSSYSPVVHFPLKQFIFALCLLFPSLKWSSNFFTLPAQDSNSKRFWISKSWHFFLCKSGHFSGEFPLHDLCPSSPLSHLL